jgi:integrase
MEALIKDWLTSRYSTPCLHGRSICYRLDHKDIAQMEEELKANSYEDSDLVFATGKGTPLDAQNIVNRHFKPLLRGASLPSIRWHDLRHTCATLLLGRGVHPKLVQHLLGHASITMTLDRYSHWIPSMGRHAADGMDEALG